MPKAVVVENISKRFLLGETFAGTLRERLTRTLNRNAAHPSQEEFWALRDVAFDVEQGEAVGIIGGNGAGKSTLLKILSRITSPTRGRAFVRGRISSLLEVGTGFHPELTGRENIYLNGSILGMRKHEISRKFDEIVSFSGVEKFIDTPVKRYSSGMYVRLAFAVAAHLEPDVLVIDEVLAVGDAEFQRRCLDKMNDVSKHGRTVLFVSHNLAAIQKLCSRAIWLQQGRVELVDTTDVVASAYLEKATNRNLKRGDRPLGQVFSHEYIEAVDGPAAITSVQLRDRDGAPTEHARTWDDVSLSLEFEALDHFGSLAVEIAISTLEGTPLIVTSTNPDQLLPFGVEPGRYSIQCTLKKLPLAVGEYEVSLRLTIPWIKYVWRADNAFRLIVDPVDVFNSGYVSPSIRSALVVPSEWTQPAAIPSQGRN